MNDKQVNESLSDLKRSRAVLKCMISKADRHLENIEQLPKETIKLRIDALEEYWNKFKSIQHSIELQIIDEDLDKELEYRIEMEDKYYKVIDKLQIRWGQLAENMVIHQESQQNVSQSNTQVTRSITSSITHIPFQENESLKNIIRRLEVYLHLHGNSMQPIDKVYTLLHALTPQLHQKLYDLCVPDSPLDKTYTELVQILSEYVDPQPSTWALQHRFMSHAQGPLDTVKIYCTELQKLTFYYSHLMHKTRNLSETTIKYQLSNLI